jgi:hypothetical protein
MTGMRRFAGSAPKPGMAFFVVLFPDGDDLFDSDVGGLAIVALQMQHAAVDSGYYAAHAGSGATKDVDPSVHERF